MISKLSSFRKEEFPKGEVVGEICRVSDSYFSYYYINRSNHSFPTTPPDGHPSFQKEGNSVTIHSKQLNY